jgi:hypothetical protein
VEKIPTDPTKGPADKVWDDYFRTHDPDPRAVCDVVARLDKAKRREDVIACINAALIHGRSQPWMYTVLALEMELAGRPREEIERVLLSNVDFSAVNVDNLLYSGAFLTRFGAKARALGLYRQASLVDPTRLEPYAMALDLARDADDPVAVGWAASGILQRAWGPDHQTLHKNAIATAAVMEESLRKRGDTAAADRLAAEIAEARKVDLRIELTWSGKADLDLLVEEPSGSVCSSDNAATVGGGVFVHDGFGGDDQKDCHDDYVCPRGMSGDYRVIVRHISGNVVGKRAVLNVIRYQGTSREIVDQFTVKLSDADKVVRVTLQDGRLKDLSAVNLLEKRPEEVRGGKNGRRDRLIADSIAAKRARGNLIDERPRNRGNQPAPGYQPLITVLSDGVTNTAMAVISGDRRYVRLTMVPQFTAITDIATFTFFNSGGGGNSGQGGGGGGGTGGNR